jgi:hypothetical protein
MQIKSSYNCVDASDWSQFSGCCGATYFETKQTFQKARHNQTENGITLYEGSDLEESNEDNGKYICSKVETKNGTFFVKVRTQWH